MNLALIKLAKLSVSYMVPFFSAEYKHVPIPWPSASLPKAVFSFEKIDKVSGGFVKPLEPSYSYGPETIFTFK